MKIGFHGAAQTVTGSRHLIHINGHRLLLDCGLYQGRRKETYDRNRSFPFPPKKIDAVILSHAHIDHSGNLPNMVRNGYSGPIHATKPTVHLTALMTRDSGAIQESDAHYLNKKLVKKGEPLIEPLYTQEDAILAAQQLVEHSYEEPFEPVPGVVATFVDAGHILGSAAVLLELEENGRKQRLLFSGDIGRPGLPLIPDPILPSAIDLLIMESTYGDRTHDSPHRAYEELHTVASRTIDRGGKVIIPAFAVGRTQSLVFYLHQMFEAGELPEVPVYVDSPLAIGVTKIFRECSAYFDSETRAFVEDDPHGAALGFDMLHYTPSVEESKAINEYDEPAVIISASGMAETGRILHHLKNNLDDERNTVLFTSWMAPHTLGRRIKDGATEVKIFGELYEVHAEVDSVNGLSAHASQPFLLDYASACGTNLKDIFLVHGEPGPAQALMEKLAENGTKNISYPEMDQIVEI